MSFIWLFFNCSYFSFLWFTEIEISVLRPFLRLFPCSSSFPSSLFIHKLKELTLPYRLKEKHDRCRTRVSWCFPGPFCSDESQKSQISVKVPKLLTTFKVLPHNAVYKGTVASLWVFFCWAAFQPPFPKLLCGVVVTQAQDQALNILKCHAYNDVPEKEQGRWVPSEYYWGLVQRKGSLSWCWNSS